MNPDICLKFSAYVHHMFAQIWKKKILAIAHSACQPRPISAKTLDASSDGICWDILKRKKLVRFWTYLSNLMEGIFNISQKMGFWSSASLASTFRMSTAYQTFLYKIKVVFKIELHLEFFRKFQEVQGWKIQSIIIIFY